MEVRNIKRRLAMVLCVCILCASAMPAALAEDVVQVQAATPSEAKPELAQMTKVGAEASSLPVFLPAHMPQTFSIMTRQAETTPERVRRLSRT